MSSGVEYWLWKVHSVSILQKKNQHTHTQMHALSHRSKEYFNTVYHSKFRTGRFQQFYYVICLYMEILIKSCKYALIFGFVFLDEFSPLPPQQTIPIHKWACSMNCPHQHSCPHICIYGDTQNSLHNLCLLQSHRKTLWIDWWTIKNLLEYAHLGPLY